MQPIKGFDPGAVLSAGAPPLREAPETAGIRVHCAGGCGSRQHRARGFTLIEAMIVVAVLAILAGIAVPSMQSAIASSRARSAANEVLAGLNLAKMEAIRRNAAVRFCVDPTARAWTVATTGGTQIQTGSVPDGVGITSSSLDTASVVGQACVRFRADGLSYGAGNTLITNGALTVTAGAISRVVNVRTGAVHVG